LFDAPIALVGLIDGVTRLSVSCHGPDCWHRDDVDVCQYSDDVIVAIARPAVLLLEMR
jgi:hypothetical protein